MTDKVTYGESIEMPGRWVRLDYETHLLENETCYDACVRAQREAQKFLNERIHQQLFPTSKAPESLPEEQVQPKDGWERLVDAINSCTELDGNTGLKTFEKLVELNKSKHPAIQTAYDNKLKELTK